MSDSQGAIVIVPTYNEWENLSRLVASILSELPDGHILIVDDNSPDGTGEVADQLAFGDPRIKVHHRPLKQGLGTAYLAGFNYALAAGYSRVVQMDGDFSHRTEDLPRLLAAVDDADVAIGSRNVPGSRVVGWSLLRTLVSRAGSFYARTMLGLPVRDCTSGFKCFRRSALLAIDRTALRANGYAFQVEVTYACAGAGLRMVEVPIIFPDRALGKSKMSPRIVLEAAFLVLRLRYGRSAPRRRAGSTADTRPAGQLPGQESPAIRSR
ncbi:MAG: polyprenol monophosphomannose synthase [Chloroflexi bacterium]|nr:MAG: polyprenol monophosphomannose synthase [Chloroflexota bacterium]